MPRPTLGAPGVGGAVTRATLFQGSTPLPSPYYTARTATYLLRLQNNSGAPAAIGLDDIPNSSCPSSFTVVVKQGTANSCPAAYHGFTASGPSGNVSQYSHVITAA